MRYFFLICFLPILTFAFESRTLGLAGGELVSSRDVEIHQIVAKTIFSYNMKQDSTYPLGAEPLKQELSNYMLDNIVFLEAQSLKLAQVPRSQIEEKRKLFLQKISHTGAHSYWRQLEVSDKELSQHIERKIRVRKFVALKRKSSERLFSDNELKDYYQQNQTRFVAGSFENQKDRVRHELIQRQGEERLREWFQVLKQKYKVSVF